MAATRVISFVGSEVRDVDVGLDFLDFINLNLSKQKLLLIVRHYKYEKQWRAIGNLFDQEYWRRVWVVQEIVVASKVLVCYGRRSVKWEKFSRLIKHLVDLSETGELRGYLSRLCFTGPAMLDRLRRVREDKGQGWSLASMLQLCIDAQSTDPRDKIYGLLGLQDPITDDGDILYLRVKNQDRLQKSPSHNNEIGRPYARGRIEEWKQYFSGVTDAPRNFPRSNGIEADYSKSVLQLWEEVMSWPNLWDDFDLLKFSQLVQEVLGCVPMDYVEPFTMAKATTNDDSGTSELRSSDVLSEKDQPSQKFFGKQKAVLSSNPADARIRSIYYTAGICRSTILFMGPPYAGLSASLKLLRQWIKLYFHPTKKLENTGGLPPVLTTGIAEAENDLHRIIPIESPRSYAKFGEWAYVSHLENELGDKREVDLSTYLSSQLSSSQIIDEDLCLNPEKIASSLKPSPEPPMPTPSKQARWFISDRGQIGLAPYSAEEGDLICQFKSCDIVALARKLGARKTNGELVGRAILMQRWEEKSDNSVSNRFRYSVPDRRCWENRNLKELPEVVDQERVSLYVDIKALWALTR